MNMNSGDRTWKTLDKFIEMQSKWLTLIGEHLEDDRGQILEYWRVEKPHSVVVVTIQGNKFIFPPPSFRPGAGKATLDFPGGRLPAGETPLGAVAAILQKELGVETEAIASIFALNSTGWEIDSSFSSHKLYGFVAEIYATATIPEERIGASYAIAPSGILDLLGDLTCLQCRALLLEWQRQFKF